MLHFGSFVVSPAPIIYQHVHRMDSIQLEQRRQLGRTMPNRLGNPRPLSRLSPAPFVRPWIKDPLYDIVFALVRFLRPTRPTPTIYSSQIQSYEYPKSEAMQILQPDSVRMPEWFEV